VTKSATKTSLKSIPGCVSHRLLPIETNLVDKLFASPLKPRRMTATMMPAISPYSKAVAAFRSQLQPGCDIDGHC
jgi:hypothetical protein